MTSPSQPSATPLVAVITRTKDRPIMLERAIASVLGQTSGDWLHVIVNDVGDPGPVDALVARHAEAYAGRVAVVHRTGSTGMESASNAGIAASESRYVVIHDDDDTWAPDFLEATTGFLAAEPAYRGVVTHSRIVNERIEDGRVVRIEDVPFNAHLDRVTLAQVAAHNLFTTNAFVFERAVIDEIGPFREDLPVLGDWEFNLRFLARHDIGLLPRELAFYHHRVSSGAAYDNSVFAARSRHASFEAALRNQLLRHDIAEGKPGLGMMANLAAALRDEVRRREDNEVLEARLRDAIDSGYRYHAEVSGLMEERGRLLQDQDTARATIEDLRREVADLRAVLDRRTTEMQAEREEAVTALRDELEARSRDLAAVTAHRDEVEQALNSVLGSTSWRAMAPVRAVLGRLAGRRT